MAQDLSPGKSACILAVVVGCFAILWPSIFYPMLKGSVFPTKHDGNENHRQEQSHYHRPNAMHPTMREHGRATQQRSATPPSRERRSVPPPVIAAKKPPIAGLRPPMTGGHVPSQKDNGPMGILMPLYTVGIIIFFVYTITKLVCKKHDSNAQHDPELNRLVYQKTLKELKQTKKLKSSGSVSPDISKLGWQENDMIVSAISSLLQEVNHDIMKREMKKEQREIQPTEDSTPDENSSQNPVVTELEEEQSKEIRTEAQAITENSHKVNYHVQVTGGEMSTSCTKSRSQKQSPAESPNKSSIPKTNHKKIVADEIKLPANEPKDSKTSIPDASVRKAPEKPAVINDGKVILNDTKHDSNHKEADENSTKENEREATDEDIENISENNKEEESSEQNFPGKEDIPTTEL